MRRFLRSTSGPAHLGQTTALADVDDTSEQVIHLYREFLAKAWVGLSLAEPGTQQSGRASWFRAAFFGPTSGAPTDTGKASRDNSGAGLPCISEWI